MGAKSFLCLILLLNMSGLTTAVFASYIIQPSQLLQTYDYRMECDDLDNSDLTLSQFVDNLSDYLENDTTLSLIFLPGKYSLESDLIIENVHSFSMHAWPGSSSKVEITCGHKARFEFSNVSTVTISGLEFIGCFQNRVITVRHFQLENSGFFGNRQPIVSDTSTAVLSIKESTANLDGVVFNDMVLSAVYEQYYYHYHCYSIEKIFSNVDRVTGIALRSSNVTIIHSRFERNNVGLKGAVIFIEFNSDLVIINSTFVNNRHRLMNNYRVYSGFCDAIIRVTDSNLTVSHSKFNNNTGGILRASSTEVSIRHSEFHCNNGDYYFDEVLATIDRSNFVNNTSPGSMLWVTAMANRSEVSISYSEFLCNNGGNSLYYFDGVLATYIDHSKFINNTIASPGRIFDISAIANRTEVRISYSEFLCNNGSYYFGGVLATNIDHSKFINNTSPGSMLYVIAVANRMEVSISYSEFLCNYGSYYFGGVLTTNIDHSKFINNTSPLSMLQVTAVTNRTEVSISYSEFFSNNGGNTFYYFDGVLATNIDHSKFVNNTSPGSMLYINAIGNRTEVGISYSEFLCNNGRYYFGGVLATNIDHSKFINNTSPLSMLQVTAVTNRSEVSISYSEFLCNNGGNSLYYFDGVLATYIDHSKFINNTIASPGRIFDISAIANRTEVRISYSEFLCNNGSYYFGGVLATNIDHSKFINNTSPGSMLYVIAVANRMEVSISYSEFLCNYGSYYFGGVLTTNIDHSKFINNTSPLSMLQVTAVTNRTEVSISYSEFFSNNGGNTFYYFDGVLATNIDHSKFVNNTSPGSMLYINAIGNRTEVGISYSEFLCNNGRYYFGGVLATNIDHSKFINNTSPLSMLQVTAVTNHTEVSISHSEFLRNNGSDMYSILFLEGVLATIDHSTFIHNTGYSVLYIIENTNMTTLHIHLNEFIDNNIPTGWAVVFIPYYTTVENLTGNVFINNNAIYEIFITSVCGSNLGISLGSSPCTPCSDDWYIYLIGIVVAAFIAGIALVILMLVLNLTVAIGTLNGILFYANTVAINTDTYFLRSMAPNFVTVFISWLNFDIGFDVCFTKAKTSIYTSFIKLYYN